jgi:hypothetical protein
MLNFNTLIRFISLFILRRENRDAFCKRCLDFLQRIRNLEKKVNYVPLGERDPRYEILSGICDFSVWGAFAYVGDQISEDDYARDVENLFFNLDETASAHLNTILEKKDKLYYSGAVLLKDLYSDEKLRIRALVDKFEREPRWQGGGVLAMARF